ncbi:MAG: hypothetical protein AAGL10_12815 [Pseudomonadota bacterium]
MHIHPAIAALRKAKAAQREMQSEFSRVIKDWLDLAQSRAIADELQVYCDGGDLDDCPALDRLVSDELSANAFVQQWQRTIIAAMQEFPLGVPSFGHAGSDGFSSMVLLSSGNASLSILAYEDLGYTIRPTSAVFSDRQTHEIVLSGQAGGLLHEVRQCDGVDTIIDTCSAHWRSGATIVTKGPCEARQVVSVEGSMVVLQLSLQSANPQPTREYALFDGDLIQSASGDKAASQRFMALSVLGAIAAETQTPSTLEAMERCARDRREDPVVRWEAVRQLLALKASKGLALLASIEACGDDVLKEPAGQLRIALQSEQPELFDLLGRAQ